MKKPEFSAKPGDLRDAYGDRTPIYVGKPSERKDIGKYKDRDYSERRRAEIKRSLLARGIVREFSREIRATVRLTKKLK